MNRLLTTTALARALDARGIAVSESTLRGYEADGLIPRAARLGMRRAWPETDLDAIAAGIDARRKALAARRTAA